MPTKLNPTNIAVACGLIKAGPQRPRTHDCKILLLPGPESRGAITWPSASGKRRRVRLPGPCAALIEKNIHYDLGLEKESAVVRMSFAGHFARDIAPDAAWRGVAVKPAADIGAAAFQSAADFFLPVCRGARTETPAAIRIAALHFAMHALRSCGPDDPSHRRQASRAAAARRSTRRNDFRPYEHTLRIRQGNLRNQGKRKPPGKYSLKPRRLFN